jgi:hypothetical protein
MLTSASSQVHSYRCCSARLAATALNLHSANLYDVHVLYCGAISASCSVLHSSVHLLNHFVCVYMLHYMLYHQ